MLIMLSIGIIQFSNGQDVRMECGNMNSSSNQEMDGSAEANQENSDDNASQVDAVPGFSLETETSDELEMGETQIIDDEVISRQSIKQEDKESMVENIVEAPYKAGFAVVSETGEGVGHIAAAPVKGIAKLFGRDDNGPDKEVSKYDPNSDGQESTMNVATVDAEKTKDSRLENIVQAPFKAGFTVISESAEGLAHIAGAPMKAGNKLLGKDDDELR